MRQLLSILLVWAVLFVPFAHSTALGAHVMFPDVHHDAMAHNHDHDAEAHEHSCHHGEQESDIPSSTDPCSMCQSHPVCHMVVLPVSAFELPAIDALSFEIGLSPPAMVLSFKPPLGVPRL